MYKRQKRLAGPAFYVNVRFDQHSMNTRRERRGQKLGDFDSVRYNFVADHEVFDVKEGEILVSRRSGSRIQDGFPRCLSSFNGWDDVAVPDPAVGAGQAALVAAYPANVRNTLRGLHTAAGPQHVKMADAFLRDALIGTDKVQFLGIAATEHKAEKVAKFDQGFVACVEGVRTVINESGETLHPGDKLTYDLPVRRPQEEGIHDQKVRLRFRKHRGAEDIHKPVVGKAMSYSRNGNRVDILLHPQKMLP